MSDEPRMPLDPEAIAALLGPPAFAFVVPTKAAGLRIPKGGRTCCRALHQPTCRRYIARSLVGGIGTLKYPRRRGERRGLRQLRGTRGEYPGDVLADPLALTAAAKTIAYSLGATAGALGASLLKTKIAVWSLDLETAAVWMRHRLAIEEAARQRALQTGYVAELLARLPFKQLDPDSSDEELASILDAPDFHEVGEYAAIVQTVPGERGHDGTARYVLETVWPEDRRVVANVFGLTELGPPGRELAGVR